MAAFRTTSADDLRRDFLSAPCAAVVPVRLPNGPTVYVRPLPYADLVELRERGREEDPDVLVRVAALALTDAAGGLLFDAESREDLAALAGRPTPALQAILNAAIDASAVDVEAAKKN